MCLGIVLQQNESFSDDESRGNPLSFFTKRRRDEKLQAQTPVKYRMRRSLSCIEFRNCKSLTSTKCSDPTRVPKRSISAERERTQTRHVSTTRWSKPNQSNRRNRKTSFSVSSQTLPKQKPYRTKSVHCCNLQHLCDGHSCSVNKHTRIIPFSVNSLLHYAVIEQDLQLVTRLVKTDKIHINQLSTEGTAPLHEACRNGHLECISILYQHGAELNLTDKNDMTPVEYAVQGGYFDCALFLLNLGADSSTIRDGIKPNGHI